jgi:hypothetical protein
LGTFTETRDCCALFAEVVFGTIVLGFIEKKLGRGCLT